MRPEWIIATLAGTTLGLLSAIMRELWNRAREQAKTLQQQEIDIILLKAQISDLRADLEKVEKVAA